MMKRLVSLLASMGDLAQNLARVNHTITQVGNLSHDEAVGEFAGFDG